MSISSTVSSAEASAKAVSAPPMPAAPITFDVSTTLMGQCVPLAPHPANLPQQPISVITGSHIVNGTVINAKLQAEVEMIKNLTAKLDSAMAENTSLSAEVELLMKERKEAGNEINSLEKKATELKLAIANAEEEGKLSGKRSALLKQYREADLAETGSLNALVAQKEKEVQTIVAHLICAICQETLKKPRILGMCGHAACEDCIQSLDAVSIKPIPQAAADGTVTLVQPPADQILKARRCASCRADRFDIGIPALGLDHLSTLLTEPKTPGEIEEWQKKLDLQMSSAANKAHDFGYKDLSAESHAASIHLLTYLDEEKMKGKTWAKVIMNAPAKYWESGIGVDLFPNASKHLIMALQDALKLVGILITPHLNNSHIFYASKKPLEPKQKIFIMKIPEVS